MTPELGQGMGHIPIWSIAAGFGVFLLIVFSAFFFWNRLANDGSDEATSIWSKALVGAGLACALFVICFVLGVWFSIARLKGEGWMLSV
ncbi:MAG: hypothetical protein RBT63_05700 [Bdellovibrionales bacterium]|jgi:hypothetical protein|nr:hypothetical protein [Bdellovibrionales bacterium]